MGSIVQEISVGNNNEKVDEKNNIKWGTNTGVKKITQLQSIAKGRLFMARSRWGGATTSRGGVADVCSCGSSSSHPRMVGFEVLMVGVAGSRSTGVRTAGSGVNRQSCASRSAHRFPSEVLLTLILV